MSDEQPPAGTGAPAAPVTPAAPPVQTAPPAPPAAPVAPPGDPDWLPGRLAQAKRAREAELLAELGVASVDEVRAAVTAQKATPPTPKTAEERLALLEQELAGFRTTVGAQAATEMAALTDGQRAAVKRLAGDDPSKQISTIAALRETWASAPAPAAAPAQTATPPAPTPPVTTAPPANSAPAPTNESPPDHKAEYSRLKQTNPYEAAAYLREHSAAIYPH